MVKLSACRTIFFHDFIFNTILFVCIKFRCPIQLVLKYVYKYIIITIYSISILSLMQNTLETILEQKIYKKYVYQEQQLYFGTPKTRYLISPYKNCYKYKIYIYRISLTKIFIILNKTLQCFIKLPTIPTPFKNLYQTVPTRFKKFVPNCTYPVQKICTKLYLGFGLNKIRKAVSKRHRHWTFFRCQRPGAQITYIFCLLIFRICQTSNSAESKYFLFQFHET
eukprot:TRINITY_DN19028_c0_g2_i2.p1 TRINITY_DN19028_c0_g2~~TRINITY_DN19028_c0_g2_i2.p1  ORF type:complete len:223 (+),score=-25.87 TRINITY_DN19028_c0_g2_i2:31-699(+)